MARDVLKGDYDVCIPRRCSPDMRLDYHECADATELVCVLNDIAYNGFLLEKVILQPGERFVVLFRRNDFG